MSVEDVSIKSIIVDGAAVSQTNSDSRIGNALKSGNTGAAAITSEEVTNKEDLKNIKRSESELDKTLNSIVGNTKISLKNAYDILNYCGYSKDSLMNLDSAKFKQVLKFFTLGLKHIAEVSGNVDAKEIAMTMLSYKIAVVYKELDDKNANEFVKKYNTMDLLDILQEQIPELQGKNLNEVSTEELKEVFKGIIKNLSASNKKLNPQVVMEIFLGSIGKCDSDEKTKIFQAFALLMRDEQMNEFVPIIFEKTLDILAEVDASVLLNFIHECPQFLESLGLSKEIIQALQALGLSKLKPEQLKSFKNEIIQRIRAIPKNELQPTMQVIQKIQNGTKFEELTDQEKELFNKYSSLINDIVNLLTGTGLANIPNDDKDRIINPIIEELEEYGILDPILELVGNQSNTIHTLFNNLSNDEITKLLNKATNNRYSEIIGDNNTDNLYKENQTSETSDGIGLIQRVSAETCSQSTENLNVLKAQIVEETTESPVVETNLKPKKSEQSQHSVIKTQVLKSAESFNYAIAQGILKIDDAGKDFEKACKSVQQKVISYLQVQKNNRLDLINKWHNSHLADVAVNRFNFTKEQIEELKLSIGKKQVMIHNYEQKHKTDEV